MAMAKLVWVTLIFTSAVVAMGVAFETGEHGGPDYRWLKTEPTKSVKLVPFKPAEEPNPLSKNTTIPVPTTPDRIPVHTETYWPNIPTTLPAPAVPERVIPHYPHTIIGRTHHEKKHTGGNICEAHHGVKVVTGKTWHCVFAHH